MNEIIETNNQHQLEVVNNAISEIKKKDEEASKSGFDYGKRRDFASYQAAFGGKANEKRAKAMMILMSIIVLILGIAVFASSSYQLFQLVMEIGKDYEYSRWIAIGLSALLLCFFLILYIIFIAKIRIRPKFNNYYYESDPKKRKQSQIKNRETRRKIAKHIVDIYEQSDLLISTDPLENTATEKICDLVIHDKELYNINKFPLVRMYDNDTKKEIKDKYITPIVKSKEIRLVHPRSLETNTYNALDLYNLKMALTIRDKFIDVDNTGCNDYINYALSHVLRRGGLIYNKARSMMVKSSVTTGLLTAASPSGTLDAAIIALHNMKLISDLVSLYGFRLNDAQMSKLMTRVMVSTVTSLGLGSLPLGNLIASKVIPNNGIITGLVRGVIDFAAQTITNGLLTLYVGHHTIKYMMDEFALQSALDISDKTLLDTYMPLAITDKVKAVIGDFIQGKIDEARLKNENASFSDEELNDIEHDLDASNLMIKGLKSTDLELQIEKHKKEQKECEEEMKRIKKKIDILSKQRKEALWEEKHKK